MATVANPYNPNDQQEENQGGGGHILSSSAPSPGEGGGASNPASGGSAPQRAPLSGTPNIQQYLQANQGAGQRLAGGIQSNAQNQAQKVGENVKKAGSDLNAQYQPLQQNLQQGQQTIQSAFQNPQALLDAYNASKSQSSSQPLNQNQQQALGQYNQFQQLNSGGYNPAISQYGNTVQQTGNQLQGQLSNLQQQAGSAATESGRFGLLQKAVGQPNYNSGQQTLDALFLQAQPGVANQLKQNLGNIAQQAGQQIGSLNSDAQSRLAALQGLSAQNQQMIKNQFGQELGNIGTNVKGEYDQLAQSAPQSQAALKQAFQSNQFSPQQLEQLKLQSGTQTWGLKPEELMAAGHFQANPLAAASEGGYAQAASPEEFARYNALNQLAGGGPGQTLQQNIFGGAGSAGGYSPVSYDPAALQNTLQERQKAVTQDFASGISGWSAPEWANLMPANEIKQGLAAGTMSPEEAKAKLDAWNDSVVGANNSGLDRGQLAGMESPFYNYFNQTYSPLASAKLGASSPDAASLPTDPNTGAIDWSKINRPGGK